MQKTLLSNLTPNLAVNLIYSEGGVSDIYLEDDTINDPLVHIHTNDMNAISFHTKEKEGMKCTIYIMTPWLLSVYYPFPLSVIATQQQTALSDILLTACQHKIPQHVMPQTVGDFKLIKNDKEYLAYYCITPFIDLVMEDLQVILTAPTISAREEIQLVRQIQTQREQQRLADTTVTAAVTTNAATAWASPPPEAAALVGPPTEPIVIHVPHNINWQNVQNTLYNNEE